MSPAVGRGLVSATIALLALAAAGCGGGDAEEAGDDVPASASEAAGEPSSTPGAAGDTPTAAEAPTGGREAGAPAGGGDAPRAAPSDPPRTGAGPAAPPALLTTTGTIQLTGTVQTPMPTLRTADATWLLQGDAAVELRRLDGATVRVTGRPGGEPGLMRPLDVASYEIESIDGDRPFVGRVDRTAEGTLVLVTDDGTLRLGGAGGLAAEVGAQVWVVGDRSGDALSVASYGIIRPAA